jgi:UDPglucose--hexose-1-phosphate uridylyltransferase
MMAAGCCYRKREWLPTCLLSLVDLASAERRTIVHTMQRVTQAYDRLFQVPMPYMMLIHQRPTDGRDYPQAHLHVEFYPILRDSGKLKYLAGSESGAGVFINDTLAEASAARLRELIESPA